MTQTQIESKVKEIIAEKLDVEESEVTLDASLIYDLGAHYLDVLNLLVDFEDAFGITIEYYFDASDEINTVGDAIDYVKKMLDEKQKNPGRIIRRIR